MKKIAIIGTVGLPAKYGGFETLAEQLVKNLGDKYKFTVYCSGLRYKNPDRPANFRTARLKYFPLNANGIQSIPYDILSIIHALFYADVLLVLGVAGAFVLPFVRLFTNKRIIVSIDGIEWKRDKWNILARCYLFLAEKIAVKYSHIDISDNESIQDYTALRYGSLSRVIEYGADHTIKVKSKYIDGQRYPFLKRSYAFNVCRIEPENNVHHILRAFANLPRYPLVIVGNWNNSSYGKTLRKQYESYLNITMLDPIYNQKKLDLLRGNAMIYIHGHSAGGTNPSLVEAMYLGLPILAYGVSYNRTTTENEALYFKSHIELKEMLKTTTVCTYLKIGKKMKSIAKRRYNWSVIASKYDALIVESLMVNEKKQVKPIVMNINSTKLLSLGIAHLKNQQLFFERQ